MNTLLNPTKYGKSPSGSFPRMNTFSTVAYHAMAARIPCPRAMLTFSVSAEDTCTMPCMCHPDAIPGARDVNTWWYGTMRVYEWGPREHFILSQRCHPLSGLFQLCSGAGGRRISFDASWSAIIIHNDCDVSLWQRNVRGETDSSDFNTKSTEPRLQQHDVAWLARCLWRLVIRHFLGQEATPPSRSWSSFWVV